MRPDIPANQVIEKMTEMQGAQAVGAWQHWMSTLYGLESDVYGDQHFSARLGTFEPGAGGHDPNRGQPPSRAAHFGQHGTPQHRLSQDRGPWHGEARVCQNGREAVMQRPVADL